ncbi:hypothetical protein AYI69_g11287 [Smittium culicis]|uniref:Uncharacterized protein n=1 Tax=Smittium culicis TaxID=133412 RepID=A0A1R1WZT4_9FUNG|nr:hypothetical protein AYI69_g11287 [Smittium culicis]
MPQSNPNLSLDYPSVGVLKSIRCRMENAAFMETMNRQEKLHSGIFFTGNPEQVDESEVKPLMYSGKFDTKLVANKSTKRDRVRKLFCARQKIEGNPSPVNFFPETAPVNEVSATKPAPNSSLGGF